MLSMFSPDNFRIGWLSEKETEKLEYIIIWREGHKAQPFDLC